MREPSPTTSSLSSSTCYFTYTPSPSHYSDETPFTPLFNFHQDIYPDTLNPLLAGRSIDSHYPSAMDASKLLQLQTAAAHGQSRSSRPTPQPLQTTGNSLSNNSSVSSGSSSSTSSDAGFSTPRLDLCCARCRRTACEHSVMVQFGTNLYYCSHCASITGYRGG